MIGQRKIEQEIRLREGEVNIMGGILESTQTKSLSGIPGLASIPLFKYLFAEETKQTNDNEIVFILIPHIVRAQDLNDSNVKAIDVGTANTISLHHGMTEAPDQQQHGAQPSGTPGNIQREHKSRPPQPQACCDASNRLAAFHCVGSSGQRDRKL